MKFFKKKYRVIGALVLALVIGCTIYLANYYHADMTAIEKFTCEKEVSIQKDSENNLLFAPENATCGFLFYPGGKVEYTSYIPLMKTLASEGILCVLVEMPFHLAVFDVNAANGIPEQYPEIEHWYIGGHSLGGSMAASYLESHSQEFEGLVLLGAYATADLSETDLEVLSIYGSEDRVMNQKNYAANKKNLPVDFTEIIIEGGCHAYFGMYGSQKGDGTPTITNEDQIFQTVDAMTEMILR